MGKSLQLALVGWLVAGAALLMGCAADTHTVGDDLGWTIPPVRDSAYQTWANTNEFDVGDIITFNWNGNGAHTVAQVTKEGYDNCSAANSFSVAPVQTVSPYSFTLNSTAPQYFICTVGDHCTRGQKVTIQVGSGSFSAASPTTTAFSAIFLAVAASISLFI